MEILCYPSELLKLNGRNFKIWKSQVETVLHSLRMLNRFKQKISDKKCGHVYTQAIVAPRSAYSEEDSKLAIFLLTSIEKSLHYHFTTESSLLDPVDVWITAEKFGTRPIMD